MVRLTLSIHFLVSRENFASEQLAGDIAGDAVSRHGVPVIVTSDHDTRTMLCFGGKFLEIC